MPFGGTCETCEEPANIKTLRGKWYCGDCWNWGKPRQSTNNG